MINFQDLQTKGYVIIRNYLDANDLARLQNDYHQIRNNTSEFSNKNYQVLLTHTHNLTTQIRSTLDEVGRQTNLHVDTITSGATYFDNSLIDFSWHQDHEPYYIQQDSYHGLNFWIPLIKEDPDLCGLSIVPFDQLTSSARNALVGRGASQFVCQHSSTIVSDDENGSKWYLDVNLDTVAETPSISPGDLLLMRHDLIHRTQEGTSLRVAMSVRCYNSESTLVRSKYFGGCFKKQLMIKNNAGLFQYITNKFKNDNVDKFQLKTLLEEQGKK